MTNGISKCRLTVVVPAYNVELYIGACLESIISQRGKLPLSIIVVVDGATDSTIDVAACTVAGHEDIVTIIVQENAGLSAARNAGLALAGTEYITFLDGDDIWMSDYLETVAPFIEKEEADIIEYDAARIDESGKTLFIRKIADAPSREPKLIDHIDFLRHFRCYAWARVYRAALVRAHPYPAGRRYEDSATTPWYYWSSTRTFSIGAPLVGYRRRAQSILSSPEKKDIDDIAATTAEAAAMYFETKAEYWQRVAHRSFQQACGRIILQPVHTWRERLRISHRAIAGVPPPPGFTRWLQMYAPFSYACLLFVKFHSSLLFERWAPPGISRLLFPER